MLTCTCWLHAPIADTSLWWRRASSHCQCRASPVASVLRCVRRPTVTEDPPTSCSEACHQLRRSGGATVVEAVQVAPLGQALWCLHAACLESLTTYDSPARLAAHVAAHHTRLTNDAAEQLREAHRAQSDDVLLRVEFNTVSAEHVKTVFIYSHGFPDASVTTDALAAAAVEPVEQDEDDLDDHRLYASAVTRKWGDGLLQTTSAAAFVCFNTRGVPGSGGDFYAKTLSGDIDDLELVRSYCATRFENASRLFLCGMSTGAFLSMAAAARPALTVPNVNAVAAGGVARAKSLMRWQRLRLSGVFVLACVDDIPSSVSVDFSEEQRQHAEVHGWCDTNFWPWSPANNLPEEPEQWRLGRGYLDSYQRLPPTATLTHALRVPLLLLHGDRDAHVPLAHSQRLLNALTAGVCGNIVSNDAAAILSDGEAAVETTHSPSSSAHANVSLVVVKGGNHFLSSSKAMKQALAAIRDFVKERSRCL